MSARRVRKARRGVSTDEVFRACRALAAVAIAGAVMCGELTASAQDREVADDPPKIQQIRAVERGWFVQADVGVTVFVNELENRRYGPGPQVGVFIGYDVLSILTLGVGVSFWGGEVQVDADTPEPIGDLFQLVPALRAQLALVTTERNFFWVRGDFGYGLGFPSEIDGVDYGGNGPVVGVTAGFERFTKLRHFAIGIHGGVIVLTQPDVGIGITITPTLKYTF